jgi:peptidyl-prolyl cis-trans isomerase C
MTYFQERRRCMRNVRKAGSMVVLLIAVCLTAVPAMSYAEEKKSDKVLATVGKEKITEADIYAKISMLPPQFRSRYENPEGRKKLLEQTIKFSLLSQEARSLGIDKREDVAKKIKEISDNIIIQELTKQEVSDKVAVTDEQVRAHYNADKDTFITPEKVKVNLIFFEVKEESTPEIKKKVETNAKAALQKLKKGEDFEKLAKEVSEDKRTKKRGGSTGFFSKGKRKNTYGETFETKAFSLGIGEMSDVFEGKKGFYIIKVAEKKEKKEQTLEEVKSRIERKLKQENQKEAYEGYIKGLEKKYPVKMME